MKIIDANKLIEILEQEHLKACLYDGYSQSGDAIGRVIEAVRESTVEATNISYIEPERKGKIINLQK